MQTIKVFNSNKTRKIIVFSLVFGAIEQGHEPDRGCITHRPAPQGMRQKVSVSEHVPSQSKEN